MPEGATGHQRGNRVEMSGEWRRNKAARKWPAAPSAVTAGGRDPGFTKLIVSLRGTGVTTEVCVQTTARETNDRNYECLVLEDCIAPYFVFVPDSLVDEHEAVMALRPGNR